MWKSKFYGAFALNRRVILHAIDATPARRRGGAGSSPLDRARTAASSPRNDLVKNCRAHPTHWLISTQVALHTCVVLARPDCNESFFGADHAVDAILSGAVERPRAAQPLYDALDEVLAGERPFGEHGEGRGEWLAASAAATRDEYGDCQSQVAADEALARRLAAEDERPADAWANAPAPPKDDGWARERERRRRHAGDDGPSEELREFSGERKGDDLDEIDI